MELNALIFHRLHKESNENATLQLRNTQLPINENGVIFMSRIKDVYYKKSNPYFGNFESNTSSYPFQKYLNNFLNKEIDFVEFTKQSMKNLHDLIQRIPQATGGTVVFANFTISEENFLLTFILNNKIQYNTNAELDLEEFLGLDTEKLNVANIINITKWTNNDERYLSFIRGRKEVSNYFLDFIGCHEHESAQKTSESLKVAFLDYARINKFDQQQQNNIKNNVFAYCRNQIKKNEEISLSHISSLINPDEPESFKTFASDEKYRVSPSFKGHLKTLKSLKYYHYSHPNLRIEFDDDLLKNKTIIYDPKENTLLITKVPEDLKKQILNDE